MMFMNSQRLDVMTDDASSAAIRSSMFVRDEWQSNVRMTRGRDCTVTTGIEKIYRYIFQDMAA